LATVAGAPFQAILGFWNVPAVVDPYSGGNIALWTGIQSNTSNNLVQAGTMENDQFTSGFFGHGDSFSYQAWSAWFPGPAVGLSGLAISPGQTMFVVLEQSTQQIFGEQSSGCKVTFANVTTGQWTSTFMISPTTDCDGNTVPPLSFPTDQAEWIMEACSFDSNNCVVDNPYGFLQFGAATLGLGWAFGQLGLLDWTFVGMNDEGTLINMVAPDGSLMCSAQKVPELVWAYQSTPISGG
jgi:hypothetical protein